MIRTYLAVVCFWGCRGRWCWFIHVLKSPADPPSDSSLFFWQIIMSWLLRLGALLFLEYVLLSRFNLTNTASSVSTAPQLIKLRNMLKCLFLLFPKGTDWDWDWDWGDELCDEEEDEDEVVVLQPISLPSLSLPRDDFFLIFFFNNKLE